MADRHVPVRPDLEQLRHQAKDLLRAFRNGDPAALADFSKHHPEQVSSADAKLADAQFVLARSYGVASWPRLVLACQVTDAIWRDDVETVRKLIRKNPAALHEDARGVKGNWGPPMSYAANLGRDRIISMLRALGAEDVQYAFDRACLQGKLDAARQLYAMGARPGQDAVMGPCEGLNDIGLGFVLDLGAPVSDHLGDRMAPVGMVLQTYSRKPSGKHRCLELLAEHGIEFPDTPTMAVHRGRIDLLEAHWKRDPNLFSRTFSHHEIYPLELGCSEDQTLALGGTPLAGGTLLHLCVDNDELEMAQWMIERGADVNARSAVDEDGFGGHTALFGCVVSQPYRCSIRKDDLFARLLLDHGADVTVRASLRKRLRFVDDESLHEFLEVTALEWGQRFHGREWVNKAVIRLLEERTSQ